MSCKWGKCFCVPWVFKMPQEAESLLVRDCQIWRVFFLVLWIFFSTSVQAFNQADLNGDCRIDIDDFVLLADEWLTESGVANIDTAQVVVDVSDFSVLARNWRYRSLMISEFSASNNAVIADEDGDYPDWIEVYNPSSQTVELDGLYLTDTSLDLTKWRFPDVRIEGGQMLVVFASGKDRAVAGIPLHTNFSLDKDGGNLALVCSDGSSVIDDYGPSYPEQSTDVGYGPTQQTITLVGPDDDARYFVPSDDTWQDVWMQEGFDDSGWAAGQAGVGFSVVASTNVVGYWPFDSLSAGLTPATVGNDATVFEAMGHAGQIVTLEDGLIGNALRFAPDINTAGGFGGSVNAPVAIGGPGGSFSASCWVNPDNDFTTPAQAYARILHTQYQNNFYLGTNNTTGRYMWIVNNDFSLHSADGMQSAGNWQLLTGTFDAATNEAVFYVNDVEIARSIQAADTTRYVGNMGIGNNAGSLDSYEAFSGLIDDVRIYDKALTVDEIAWLYGSVMGGGNDRVKDMMYGINTSLWIRSEFEIADLDAFDILLLNIKYEDGFAAYLNGQLIASRNAPAVLQWNSSAVENHVIPSVWTPETFVVANAKILLRPGTNVLAIQALNDDRDDGKFLLQPELVAVRTSDEVLYFDPPTPGQANGDGFVGVVADTQFSRNRGFHTDPFDLEITSDTPGAQIYYTTDGSAPSLAASFYDGPIPIQATTVIRAAAFKDGYIPSNSDTHTYIFAADVPLQSTMWTGITTDPVWGPQMVDSLLAIPTVSLVTQNEISETEQATSVELLFPDGTEGFHLDAGVEHYGGHSLIYPKKSMRLSFKREYGAAKLHYNLFGDNAAQEFDQFILRTGSHDTMFWIDPGTGSRGTYLRGRWSSDRQLEMGHPAPHGYFVHVYINGTYWGQHQLMERPNAAFLASYFGGSKEDYDAINKGLVIDGNADAWNAMVASTGNYASLQQYMDVTSYADYMLLEFYGGNDWDWRGYQNWMAARKREAGAGYQFFAWDNDIKLRRDPGTNIVGSRGGPADMWWSIRQHEEFRMLLADRAQKLFLDDGMLTDGRVIADLDALAARIDTSIIAETARWGRSGAVVSGCTEGCYWNDYTPDVWLDELDWMKYTFVPGRATTVLGQLRTAGLFPLIDAPSLSPHGGLINTGQVVMLTAPTGILYYTLDGSDPRLPGGAVSPDAQTILMDSTVVIAAGSPWKYWDSGTDPGTDWQQVGFADSAWSQGNAELGYGDGDESTVVDFIDADPATAGVQPNAATYFRRHFTVSETASILSAQIHVLRDDGAIVFVNGQELFRDNIAAGPVTYETYTGNAVEESNVFHSHTIEPTVLQEGDNVIAVEIHQATAESSDISFDLRLTVEYESAAVPMSRSAVMKTRAYQNGQWSALNEAVYAIPSVAQNLRITELMYHPADPNTEFIELQNIGDESINLNRVKFTKGIDFVFGDTVLEPGQLIVLVEDAAAFEAKYPSGVTVAGEYTGQLDNDGDRIMVIDAIGRVIHDFSYDDGWYEITDGTGFSLTMAYPASPDMNDWGIKAGWRSSLAEGGSPGGGDNVLAADSIVVNELLSHSHAAASDWIELYNKTGQAIHIGGWFLSDDDSDPNAIRKYEIPANTMIPSHGYVLFDQADSFGSLSQPAEKRFGLSEAGETVYLYSGQNGMVTGYYQTQQKFDASERDVTFGRYEKAELSGGYDFVRMAAASAGGPNSGPLVPDIVITEIYYDPDDGSDYEFLELYNRSGSAVVLLTEVTTETSPDVFVTESLPWRLRGTGFDFPTDPAVVISAGQSIIVARDPTRYTPAAYDVYGPYSGKLDNDGEEIELQIPGDLEYGQARYWIPIEKIDYGNDVPWPTSPHGGGDALYRRDNDVYGRDYSNWAAGPATPGQSYLSP